jgi:flagellar secretion chaperone FliS
MNAVLAMKHYKQVSVHSSVMDASPHRLVQMLMEGVLESVAAAKGNMINKYIAKKCKDICTAISIIAGLQASLNKDSGGEVAENLDQLYDYMCRRLVIANSNNDETILDEVISLMLEIKGGWDGIPDTIKKQ